MVSNKNGEITARFSKNKKGERLMWEVKRVKAVFDNGVRYENGNLILSGKFSVLISTGFDETSTKEISEIKNGYFEIII